MASIAARAAADAAEFSASTAAFGPGWIVTGRAVQPLVFFETGYVIG
ncbi:hypothetical protein [Bordetella genomosp. 10]|nr:hypothetical protein [Bordetella genomosp. 10]